MPSRASKQLARKLARPKIGKVASGALPKLTWTPPIPKKIQEDDSRWNWKTMGNKKRGVIKNGKRVIESANY